ncbi:unnamed protein product [Mucor hiemalis]
MLNVKLPRLFKRPSNVCTNVQLLLSFDGLQCTERVIYFFLSVDRVQRLKDARSEAAKEIEELKAQKNSEYQNFVAQHSGQSDQSLGKVDQETETKIEEIREQAAEKKGDAVEKMMKAITVVETKVHENYRV